MLEILLIEDEPEMRDSLEEALRGPGHQVVSVPDGLRAQEVARQKSFDLVISDVRLPGVDGISVMKDIHKDAPETAVILMTGYADVAQAVDALKQGAYDYLTKPFELDEVMIRVQRVEERKALQTELAQARAEIEGARETTLLGDSPSMRRAIKMIEMVALSDAPALIHGESGTGKELAARMIHERSPRRRKPFIAVNCGALTENLIEAELFGHERGSFTGAVKKRDGRFKAADGGTLFLDEVAELPMSAQAKMLRVLQEGTFEPVGTNEQVKVDVRIVSATHRNLRERIKEGLFREDLFYRLNVIEIALPALRDRPGDLPLLLAHFLRKVSSGAAGGPNVTPAAWAMLMGHSYPGNVREFSHAIEHALVLSGGREIDVQHLPANIARAEASPLAAPVPGPVQTTTIRPLGAAMRDFEIQYLQHALRCTDGKRGRTADILGISRKTLWEKLRYAGTGAGVSSTGDDSADDGIVWRDA